MSFRYMHVQVISGSEVSLTLLARIGKGSREMDVFDMLPQIALIVASLATECASMHLSPITHYVLIQLLVPACKQHALNTPQGYCRAKTLFKSYNLNSYGQQ